jgi:hypothetical protein
VGLFCRRSSADVAELVDVDVGDGELAQLASLAPDDAEDLDLAAFSRKALGRLAEQVGLEIGVELVGDDRIGHEKEETGEWLPAGDAAEAARHPALGHVALVGAHEAEIGPRRLFYLDQVAEMEVVRLDFFPTHAFLPGMYSVRI